VPQIALGVPQILKFFVIIIFQMYENPSNNLFFLNILKFLFYTLLVKLEYHNETCRIIVANLIFDLFLFKIFSGKRRKNWPRRATRKPKGFF